MSFGGGYNRNAVRQILAEISNKLVQQAVGRLIREFDLADRFGLAEATDFPGVGR